MKKTILIVLGVMMGIMSLRAQINTTEGASSLKISADARFSWKGMVAGNQFSPQNSGFRGDFLNLKASGNLAENLSFNFRQRLNRLNTPANYFNSVDYLYIDWKSGKWTWSAGKQILLVGGYEYDRPPIDIYVASEYWYNIACYQFGVSATRTFEGGDRLSFQVAQSPVCGIGDNLYSYNIFWQGTHGILSTLWSVNMIEVSRGSYLGYLALGNCLQMGRLRLEIDWMSRFANPDDFLGDDFSVMADASFKTTDRLNIFLKCSYDLNKSISDRDFSIHQGTRLTHFGAGAEYYPLRKSDNLLFFTCCSFVKGQNGNPNGALMDGMKFFNVGCKLKLDIK